MELQTVKLPEWLARLFEEAESIEPELFPCPHDIEKEDKVVGDADRFTQQLYALARLKTKERKHLEIDDQYAEAHNHCSRIGELDEQEDVLMEIFWALCKEQTKKWATCEAEGEMKIGIRKGWKIVQSPNKKGELPDALKRLISGGL